MTRRYRVVIPADCEVVVDVFANDADHALDMVDRMSLADACDDLSREADPGAPGVTVSPDGLRLDKAEARPANGGGRP